MELYAISAGMVFPRLVSSEKGCKMMQKKQDTCEFMSKFIVPLEIEKLLDVTMLTIPPPSYIRLYKVLSIIKNWIIG